MSLQCIHPARAALGEAALWTPEGHLYWLDQMRPEVHRFDPLRMVDERLDVGPLPDQLGALIRTSSGEFILAASDGLSILTQGRRRQLVNPIADTPRACFNDAKCDRQGRIWAGTTDKAETDQLGALFRVNTDLQIERISDGYICSNGPSFSPDGRTMYHTRSADRVILAYDIDQRSGAASNERVFAEVSPADGAPDGSTVDAEGHLWSTHWAGGRITRYRPDGTVAAVIEMPVRSPTSCAFGGPDLCTLYITSASIQLVEGRWLRMSPDDFITAPLEGGLFSLKVDVPGLLEPMFDLRTR